MFNWLKKSAKTVEKGLHHEAVGLDDFANAETGGLIGETISSRSQRAADRGNLIGNLLTGFLHIFQARHGKLAEQGDIDRAKAVIAADEQDLNGPDTPRNSQ